MVTKGMGEGRPLRLLQLQHPWRDTGGAGFCASYSDGGDRNGDEAANQASSGRAGEVGGHCGGFIDSSRGGGGNDVIGVGPGGAMTGERRQGQMQCPANTSPPGCGC